MANDDRFLRLARPGQIDPGWVGFWKQSNTSLPADGAVWSTGSAETWYLNQTLSTLAQTNPVTTMLITNKQSGYTPPSGLTGRAHTISVLADPGFLTGLNVYLSIANSAGKTVAVIAQDQAASPWKEHWWLDKDWVNLAPSAGTTVTISVESQSSASSKYSALTQLTYKKHTFTP